jgi:hypothetical protein
MSLSRDYPDVWLREHRGGYGYVERVPCRVLTQTADRIKIRVPLADGTTAIRYVKRERIVREGV